MFDIDTLSNEEINSLYVLVKSSVSIDDLKAKILFINYNKYEHPEKGSDYLGLPLESFYDYVSRYYDDIESLEKFLFNYYFDKNCGYDGSNKTFDLVNMCRRNVITEEEMSILRKNQIYNLEDLVNCSLDNIDGLTNVMREHLSWVRRMYNMSSYENNGNVRK